MFSPLSYDGRTSHPKKIRNWKLTKIYVCVVYAYVDWQDKRMKKKKEAGGEEKRENDGKWKDEPRGSCFSQFPPPDNGKIFPRCLRPGNFIPIPRRVSFGSPEAGVRISLQIGKIYKVHSIICSAPWGAAGVYPYVCVGVRVCLL